jgi:SpoVK/Ycf46/Vps4 family AAA+-type ATPase
MSAALQMLDAMAPCVVMIDEIDKVFSMNSGGGDSGVGARVLGKVLTHMQESKAPIFWVVTANRVDNLPPELLRKGRLDEVWSVTTPNERERLDILSIHLRKRGYDPAKIDGLALIAAETGQFVGAELEGVIKEATVSAFSAGKDLDVHMLNRAKKATKTLASAFADQFAHMKTWCEAHARPSSLEGPPKAPDGTPQRRRRSVGSDAMAG